MMHLLLMIIFVCLVATVFGIVSKQGRHEQLKYAGRVFLEFVAVGLLLAWLIYFLPI
jgi:hypothetical protein